MPRLNTRHGQRALFLSSCKSDIFYSLDLKLFSFLKRSLLLMYVKLFNDLNKTLEVIQILMMIVFFLGHPVYLEIR